jgi:hypothetical protein
VLWSGTGLPLLSAYVPLCFFSVCFPPPPMHSLPSQLPCHFTHFLSPFPFIQMSSLACGDDHKPEHKDLLLEDDEEDDWQDVNPTPSLIYGKLTSHPRVSSNVLVPRLWQHPLVFHGMSLPCSHMMSFCSIASSGDMSTWSISFSVGRRSPPCIVSRYFSCLCTTPLIF